MLAPVPQCTPPNNTPRRPRESERTRIERNNPNPKLPMVRYVGGTWRVGGLLALSRAFGDAYLKGAQIRWRAGHGVLCARGGDVC